MSFLGRLKIYGLIALAGLAAILAAALEWTKRSRDRWKLKAEYAQAELEYDRKVDEADTQIESDTDNRTQQIAEEIEKEKPVENLARPNEW